MIKKYIGSPGCGKTTHLLNIIDELLTHGESPNHIGFVTFTTAGVNEAKSRARRRFNLPATAFPYFKTLHALAFSLLALDRTQVFAGRQVKTFADMVGMRITGGDYYGYATVDDQIMFLINLANTRETDLHTVWMEHKRQMPKVRWEKLAIIYDKYTRFKSANGLFDFNDMLILAKDCDPPQLHTLIVDEAQDLSKLQWDFVQQLKTGARNVLIAGDDKQCIHKYGGAEPELFVGIGDKTYNLEQSYRVPITIQKLADRIISNVKIKHDVTWKPRDEEGFVIRTRKFDTTLFTLGDEDTTWLVLARNKTILQDYAERIMKAGVLFSIDGEPPVTKRVFEAIAEFEGEKKNKTLLQEFIPAQHYDTLIKTQQWDLAFTRLTPVERSYIKQLLKTYGRASQINYKSAKIKLSTIHASKGTEADYVLLINGMTKAVTETYTTDKDSELRVLFVGVTRARKGLYILHDERYTTYKELF